jgi:hypothetical protein
VAHATHHQPIMTASASNVQPAHGDVNRGRIRPWPRTTAVLLARPHIETFSQRRFQPEGATRNPRRRPPCRGRDAPPPRPLCPGNRSGSTCALSDRSGSRPSAPGTSSTTGARAGTRKSAGRAATSIRPPPPSRARTAMPRSACGASCCPHALTPQTPTPRWSSVACPTRRSPPPSPCTSTASSCCRCTRGRARRC